MSSKRIIIDSTLVEDSNGNTMRLFIGDVLDIDSKIYNKKYTVTGFVFGNNKYVELDNELYLVAGISKNATNLTVISQTPNPGIFYLKKN